jgi:hypothetical protein
MVVSCLTERGGDAEEGIQRVFRLSANACSRRGFQAGSAICGTLPHSAGDVKEEFELPRGQETLGFAIDGLAKVRPARVRHGQNTCPERHLAIATTLAISDGWQASAFADRWENFPCGLGSRKGL